MGRKLKISLVFINVTDALKNSLQLSLVFIYVFINLKGKKTINLNLQSIWNVLPRQGIQ